MLRTGFLDDRHIKALQILAQARVEELLMIEENPELIRLYRQAMIQLAKFQ